MTREWLNAEQNCSYYFYKHSGRIIGQAFNFAHTRIWGAKIYVTPIEELLLGQFISLETAKSAIEEYWEEKDRTFEVNREHLLFGPRSENSG